MKLNNRDALLEELGTVLPDYVANEIERVRKQTGMGHSGPRVTDLKVTFFEDGEKVYECDFTFALRILACDLWQAGDGTDLSDADSLTVGTY